MFIIFFLLISQGVIFVVDSSDRERIDEVRDELNSLHWSFEFNLPGLVMLVLANKKVNNFGSKLLFEI